MGPSVRHRCAAWAGLQPWGLLLAAGATLAMGEPQPEMLASDPRNLPGRGWPAVTKEASHAAWSAGQQPQSLIAWPHRREDGEVDRCWKTEVIWDISQGWPGQCTGLERTSLRTVDTCQVACLNNPWCSVWQFNDVHGCWQGQGAHCTTRNGYPPVELVGSQRIQHGEVRVLVQLLGIEVHGLHNIGVWGTGDVRAEVQHCKRYCYSDIYCQYWQYGEGGCWVEDPRKNHPVQYPLTLNGGASQNSEFAKTVVAGEFIQHYCPPRSEQYGLNPTALGSAGHTLDLRTKSMWRYVPYVIAGVLSLLLVLCLAWCTWDAQEHRLRTPARSHLGSPKTRSVELFSGSESDPEDSFEEWGEVPSAQGWPASMCDDRSVHPGGGQPGPEVWSFAVQVDRSGGDKIGLKLDFGDRKTLLVTRIQEDGLIDQLNSSTSHSPCVRVGDRIVAVNGRDGSIHGVKAMMDELRVPQLLSLTLQREAEVGSTLAPPGPHCMLPTMSPGSSLESNPGRCQLSERSFTGTPNGSVAAPGAAGGGSATSNLASPGSWGRLPPPPPALKATFLQQPLLPVTGIPGMSPLSAPATGTAAASPATVSSSPMGTISPISMAGSTLAAGGALKAPVGSPALLSRQLRLPSLLGTHR